MKKLSTLSAAIIFLLNVFAQAPAIQWQKCFGGSDLDFVNDIHQTTDGGYIVAGGASSCDGDVIGNHNCLWHDLWVIKIDGSGNLQWQKCYGGDVDDEARSIKQTLDGGYIVTGYHNSLNGDVSCTTSLNYWLLRLNNSGNMQWQKCFDSGGSAMCIQLTLDGGFIITGATNGSGTDVTGHHGMDDYWVIKLDSAGNLQWQKCLGGSGYDRPYYIQQTPDGGYIVVGQSTSTDGDVSGHHGGVWDGWVVKLDGAGNIQWQRCLGGTNSEELYSIQNTLDGGYIVAGTSGSNDGDVSGNHGTLGDYWIIKLNSSGTLLWQKCLGGTNTDRAFSIQEIQGSNYIIAGNTESNDGDVNGLHGSLNLDGWIVKINTIGNILWQKCIGGTYDDLAHNAYIEQTNDGGFIVTGDGESNDGDVTGFHGANDWWIVKLAPEVGIEENNSTSPISLSPNPTSSQLLLTITNNLKPNTTASIYSFLGAEVLAVPVTNSQTNINISALPAGVYFVNVKEGGRSVGVRKLVKI